MKSIMLKIRRIFLTGLVVSLPLVITFFVFKFMFESLDNILGPLVTQLLIKAGAPLPQNDYQLPGIGVVTTIGLVFLIGLFTTNFIGRKLWALGEWVLTKIPGIRSVYNAAKQVIDTFANSGEKAFSQVVMLEYPRLGIYCLAFITGKTKGEAAHRTGKNLINIFLPTTPNPTSGFYLMIPEDQLIELDMSVEDGIKMIVSGGVVTPKYMKAPGEQKSSEPKASLTTQDGS